MMILFSLELSCCLQSLITRYEFSMESAMRQTTFEHQKTQLFVLDEGTIRAINYMTIDKKYFEVVFVLRLANSYLMIT